MQTRGRPALVLLVLMAGCASQAGPDQTPLPPLLCYVGGTMRPAMEELAADYEREHGQRVELDYADSGQLLIKIETARRGDLYVCHDPFLGALMRKGLGRRGWTVASLTPVIVVPPGNPKGIRGVADLAQPGLRLGLTDATYSTLGHINPIMFDKVGLREKIEANVVARTRAGGEIANAVILGHVDAAIVWDAVAYLRRDKLQAVAIDPAHRPDPKVDVVTSATYGRIDMSYVRVTIASLVCSRQPEAADRFGQFVASPRGQAVFAKYGFSPRREIPASGPAAATGPRTLYLYCGAGLRPAMAEAVEAFTAQTGVEIQCDYAGSGMLLSRLRLLGRGDLYMPGDEQYIEEAEALGLIRSRRDIAYFVPVILVPKRNPKRIQALQDLVRPGLRLGLGDPRACAIGRTCDLLWARNRIDPQAIRRNLAFSAVTVNELGVQIQVGQLDAAIVWDALAAYFRESAEAVPIPPSQNVISRVTIGVLKSAAQPDQAEAFVAFLAGPAGQAIFRRHHYTVDPPL